MAPVWFATPVVMTLMVIATIAGLRRCQVPAWVTFGGRGAGLLVAGVSGWETVQLSLLGLMVGGLLLLPFVLAGGFGEGDALLLGTIGAWFGWQFVLWVAWWAALVGVGLALLAWRRGQRTFPYIPSIALGTLLMLVLSQ